MLVWTTWVVQARRARLRELWAIMLEGLAWSREQRVILVQAQWRGVSSRNVLKRARLKKAMENAAALVIQVCAVCVCGVGGRGCVCVCGCQVQG